VVEKRGTEIRGLNARCCSPCPNKLLPPKPEGYAGAIGGGLDGGFAGERFQEIHSASARAVEIRAIRRVGHEFGRETGAAVADGKGDFVIVGGAFELDLARSAFLATVANGVRDAFGKGEQHVMAHVIWHARSVELLARPFVNLLQLVEPAGY